MATYYIDSDGSLTTQKKKKKKKKGKTYTIGNDGVLQEVTQTDDDIAPVKTTTKKSNGYFKKSEGGVAETIIGSSMDLTKNATQGIAKIPELVGKGLLSIAPALEMSQKASMGGIITSEDWKERRKKEKSLDQTIKKDWYDEEKVAQNILSGMAQATYTGNIAQSGGMLTKEDLERSQQIQKQARDYLKNDVEKSSVFDEKADALAQSGGQLLGTMGLQAIGVPWWVTTGTTTFGGEVENALNNNATHDEAVLSGLISAGGEILSEKITGGINFGGKTLTGELIDKGMSRLLSQSISNKLMRSLVKVGVDATGEGFEEIFSELVGRLGKKLSYEDEKTWAEMFASEEAMESYLDAFIGGGVMGGVASGVKAIKSNSDGTDFVTENTANEQKVIDTETQKRIEETEKELKKKLNLSEKTKIRKQVQTEMERGELSTDTIESILGGETYEAYKSSTDEINSLKEQQKALQEQLKSPKASVQNNAKKKLSEVEEKLRVLEENYANANLKDKLSSEVQELTKSDRLYESYREVARKSQVYEADLTQYDEKTKATIQKAIDSKILNNTRKTHDFVDLIARLSAEKGVSFDFANNESLKNSGFAIEGKTINGLVSNGEVILNIDSSKALNTVVGHEITHILEGSPELYAELQTELKALAEMKGEYNTRYETLKELYKDVKDADIEKELTADLVGDYLFTDEDFIRNLSTEKPNLFKRIYEEIKYLCKKATTGSAEEKKLLEVKRTFEKLFKESGKANSDTKYSVSDSQGRTLSKEQQEFFKDSKVRDENGNLIPVYHGTRNADFTVFNRNHTYFTDSKEMADSYAPTSEKFEGYLNIKKPFVIDAQGEKWSRVPIDEETRQLLREYGGSSFKEDGLWRSTPADIVGLIEDMIDEGVADYDGVIIRNVDDTGSHGNGEETFIANDYIVFNSNQFKNIDNTNPTEDADIRFSLSETVEETKDLVAVHNMGSSELLKTLGLGGFPMPSIAIVKDDYSHNEYGDVSILFGKETIDPKKNRNNKVYGGDAWTPVFPKIDYKVSEKASKRIENEITELIGYDLSRKLGLSLDYDNMMDLLNRSSGNVSDAYSRNEGLKYAFLKSKGIDIEVPMRQEKLGKYDNDLYISIADTLGESRLEEIAHDTFGEFSKGSTKNEVAEIYHEYIRNKYKEKPELAEALINSNQSLAFNVFDGMMRSAYRYTQSGVKDEVDVYALRDNVNKYFSENNVSADYESWLGNLFSNVIESEGLRNDKDIFTPSGNRRKWEALHMEVTLENVVKAMKQQAEKGAGMMGFGSPYGASQRNFESIDDIKKAKGRLQQVDKEEYERMKSSFTDRFSEIANAFAKRKDFGATIDSGNALIENIAKSNSKEQLDRNLKKEAQWFNYSESITDALWGLVVDIQNMPTEYFEAKPQRAVGLDEIATVVLPKDVDAKLKEALADRNIPYVEYDGTAEDRLAKLNGEAIARDKKFSLGEQTAPIGNYNVYGKDIALESAVAPTKEVATQEEPTEQVLDTAEEIAPTPTVQQKSINERSEELHAKLKKKKGVYAEQGTIEDWSYFVYKSASTDKVVATWWNDTERFNASHELGTSVEDALYSVTDFIAKRELGNSAETPQKSAEQVAFAEDYAPLTEEQSIVRDDKQIKEHYFLDNIAPQTEEPYRSSWEQLAKPSDPMYDRDFETIGKQRDVNAYMYENPEVKPFFQEEARNMLFELKNSTKGEKFYNDDLYYETGGEQGWFGVKRNTSEEIAYLLDNKKDNWEDIERGLKAIIEDNGKENNATSKRIEFMLDERLRNGYRDFFTGEHVPANPEYVDLLISKEITDYSDEAWNNYLRSTVTEKFSVSDDIAPVPTQEYVAIEPERPKQTSNEHKMVRVKEGETAPKPRVNQRRWVDTSTQSEVVDNEILPEDLDVEKITYTPIPNKVTLKNANAKLGTLGYDDALTYFNSQLSNKRTTLDDIALGERLLQEAMKKGDKATAGELIQNISILGTELGQKVQALSIIQRLTPEGQLKMLHKTVNRGKIKGDKAYEDVVITEDMVGKILRVRKSDGTFDQKELDKAVEEVKRDIASQMKVSTMDKVNAWRYLSMLGNPKTHIRNLVSNVAMKGTVAVKNAVARTIEDIAPINEKTKTWKRASDEVKYFAETTTKEMKDIITGGAKYSEEASLKSKRETFKNKVLEKAYEFNSELLEKEDWWFSRPAYKNALSEYLTANGIKTKAEIDANPEIVEKAKQYALEQSEIATFRQYSWLANQIRAIENKNTATQLAVGSILPFKKTPVNIAKAGLSYSPLGFTKALTYDMYQMKQGNMQASQVVDNLAQGFTGSALTLVGYMLAMSGVLNGGGDDDKEGKYDYQLGKQSYSLNFGGSTYSLSWLSPVAMPLFVGANAYEQLVEGEEWNGDVVMETLAQTLDPLSEMSFLSSLDSVLSSYDSGVEKFAGIGEAMIQNYATQFIPTLSSQVATVLDDTKRSTKVAGDSEWKIVDETINKLKYKVPFLRETLEPSTDIWGNEIKQSENMIERAMETFIAPYSRKDSIATEIDAEIKDLYAQTGDNGIIPDIPYNYVNYDGEKYKMSAKEYTDYKQTYGQTANEMLEDLFNTTTYQNATSEDRAELVNKVYDYARDEAKREYLLKEGVDYTNATQDGVEYYKENNIKGAINNDMSLEEFDMFAKNPSKYYIATTIGGYDNYKAVTSALSDIYADKDEDGKSISGSAKRKKAEYINSLDLDYGQKIILYRSLYDSKADKEAYNREIVDYLNSREDISYEEMKAILEELDFKVHDDGTITW